MWLSVKSANYKLYHVIILICIFTKISYKEKQLPCCLHVMIFCGKNMQTVIKIILPLIQLICKSFKPIEIKSHNLHFSCFEQIVLPTPFCSCILILVAIKIRIISRYRIKIAPICIWTMMPNQFWTNTWNLIHFISPLFSVLLKKQPIKICYPYNLHNRIICCKKYWKLWGCCI